MNEQPRLEATDFHATHCARCIHHIEATDETARCQLDGKPLMKNLTDCNQFKMRSVH